MSKISAAPESPKLKEGVCSADTVNRNRQTPNEGACLCWKSAEPESPNEVGCLRYLLHRNRQLRGVFNRHGEPESPNERASKIYCGEPQIAR